MNIMKTRIYIIRHGQSLGNLNNVCLGHTDLDLTELGYSQAKQTAEALKDVEFAAIYSSDLIRARHTALPHCEIRHMQMIVLPELRELYFGDWENCSVEYLKEKYHEDFTVGWRRIFGTFTPPGGERVVDMAHRISSAVKKIAEKHPGQNVLIVSHAAAIRAFWGEILALAPSRWAENPFPSNASYSIVEYCDGKIYPKEYSIDAHLGDSATSIRM